MLSIISKNISLDQDLNTSLRWLKLKKKSARIFYCFEKKRILTQYSEILPDNLLQVQSKHGYKQLNKRVAIPGLPIGS